MAIEEIEKLIRLYANDVKLYYAIEPILGKGRLQDVFDNIYKNMNESQQRLLKAIIQYGQECAKNKGSNEPTE